MNKAEAEAYRKSIRETTKAVRTKSLPELERMKRGLTTRLIRLECGAEPDPALGRMEAPEIHRIVRNINHRIAYLERVAAGGTDPGREAAQTGTSVLHERLRAAYAEIDRLDEAGEDSQAARGLASRLKKTIGACRGLGSGLASVEEVQDQKRRQHEYAAL